MAVLGVVLRDFKNSPPNTSTVSLLQDRIIKSRTLERTHEAYITPNNLINPHTRTIAVHDCRPTDNFKGSHNKICGLSPFADHLIT